MSATAPPRHVGFSSESGKKKRLLSGGAKLGIFAFLFAVVAGFSALMLLSQAAATATYYVLNVPVAAREQISPAMLTPIKTKAGTLPPQSLSKAWVMANPSSAYARYPMRPGDILTPSDTGALKGLTAGLPAGFVVTTFQANPTNAVDGMIQRGDYIDIAATSSANSGSAGTPGSIVSSSGGATSKIVLYHVLVLDVTVSPTTISSAANGTSGTPAGAHAGTAADYTVALSPSDFTTLALVESSPLTLALSPSQISSQSLNAQSNSGQVFAPAPVNNSGAGTSNTITSGS